MGINLHCRRQRCSGGMQCSLIQGGCHALQRLSPSFFRPPYAIFRCFPLFGWPGGLRNSARPRRAPGEAGSKPWQGIVVVAAGIRTIARLLGLAHVTHA